MKTRSQVPDETCSLLLLKEQDRGLDAEQGQLPCAFTGTFSISLQEAALHGLGRPQVRTASLKPSFRAPWRVGDVVVGRGNAR